MSHRKDRKDSETAPAPMLAPDSPELRRQVAVLAGQVRALGAHVTPVSAAVERSPEDRSAERTIAAAERAAAEIRESAMREAERIRAGGAAPSDEGAGLLAGARRQRQTLVVIAAEIERLEHTTAILRAQLRLL